MLATLLRLAGIAVVVLFALSLAQDWPPTRFVRGFWERWRDWIKWYLASSPGTFLYLFILVITTWVLLGMPEEVRDRFISAQSTNLRHLTTNPIRVLFRSAFFVTGTELVEWVVLFGLILAPAERWLGTVRAFLVFAVGHVLATFGAALDVWVHIRWFHAPDALWNVQDTGASYGFMALAGLMIYRLRGWSQWLLGALLAIVVVYGIWPGHGFTARGHLFAVLIGLAMYRVTTLPQVVGRRGPGRSIIDLWKRTTADGPLKGTRPVENPTPDRVPAAE